MDVDRILEALGRLSAERRQAPAEPEPPAPTPAAVERILAAVGARSGPASAPSPGKILRLRPRSRVVAAAFGATAAATAIALVLFVRSPAGLPAYQVEMWGAETTRSGTGPDPQPPLLASPRTEVEVIARPAQPVTGEVGARAFLVAGGEVVPWLVPVARSPDGSIRLRGPIPPGATERRLLIFVGRPAALAGELPGLTERAELQRFERPLRWQGGR